MKDEEGGICPRTKIEVRELGNGMSKFYNSLKYTFLQKKQRIGLARITFRHVCANPFKNPNVKDFSFIESSY